MRLATITNWAYGTTVALTLISGTTMLLASTSQEHERAAVAERYTLDRATSTVDEDVAELSELARQFVISGQAGDLLAYQRTAAALGTVEARTRHIREAGATSDELGALHQTLRWADALREAQGAAIAARQRDDRVAATSIVFSPEYERELDRIEAAVERFQYRIDQRTSVTLDAAEATSRLWRSTSEAMLAVTGLLFLFVLYFVFRKRVLHPVAKLSDVIGRLAAQDFDVEPPLHEYVDEIGDMAQAIRVFRENGLERQRLEHERDADRALRDLLSRMTQRMQGCDSVEDLKRVVHRFVPEVAPHLAGRLYLIDNERNLVVEACSWLGPVHSWAEFSPLSCWALRRGAPHRVTSDSIDVRCNHIGIANDEIAAPATLCLPLVGQHGPLGLLYLERRMDVVEGDLPDVYIAMLAENVGLALDNLRLRDALRTLAMADPLTMLANRRELEGQLESHLAAAERQGTSISCAMIDIDHFKRFNDEYGHEAGDSVLRTVAETLKSSVREENLVFRYGGEEFLILFPWIEIEAVTARTEEIRLRLSELQLQHDGRDLGPITVSIGLACAPLHCEWQRLVHTADTALLRAKRAGRNRVVTAALRRRRRTPSLTADA